MYDVVTIGSATVDVFAHTKPTDEEVIEIKSGKEETELTAYPLGAKILITKLNTSIGGGGTNTATTFKRLGLKTGYIGKIGKDINGKEIIKWLNEEKIDFLGATGEQTAYSFILDSQAHDRTIFAYRGSVDTLKLEEINAQSINTKWVYASSLMNEAYTTLERFTRIMKSKGSKIALNTSLYLTKKGIENLKNLLRITDALILNKEEAETLVGKGEINYLLKRLKKETEGTIIITNGAQGSWCYDGKNKYYVAPKHVKVKDTTGAGDAYASTFIGGLILGRTIEEALKMAQANAESVIQHEGAKTGLLRRIELEKKAKEYQTITKKIE